MADTSNERYTAAQLALDAVEAGNFTIGGITIFIGDCVSPQAAREAAKWVLTTEYCALLKSKKE